MPQLTRPTQTTLYDAVYRLSIAPVAPAGPFNTTQSTPEADDGSGGGDATRHSSFGGADRSPPDAPHLSVAECWNGAVASRLRV